MSTNQTTYKDSNGIYYLSMFIACYAFEKCQLIIFKSEINKYIRRLARKRWVKLVLLKRILKVGRYDLKPKHCEHKRRRMWVEGEKSNEPKKMKQIEWNVIIKVKLKQIKIHETLINFCENSGKWGEKGKRSCWECVWREVHMYVTVCVSVYWGICV